MSNATKSLPSSDPMTDESGRPELIARLNRYVRTVERMQAEHVKFAEIVSHDLRAPLRGIGRLAEWLREDLGPSLPPEAERHLRMLEERVAGVQQLVEDLGAFARSGHGSIVPEPIDLNQLIDRIRALLAVEPPSEVIAAPSLPKVFGPRVPLQTVLTNIVQNALDHSGEAPRVEVSARPVADGWIRISVVDDGRGIPRDRQDRVFEIFQSFETGGRGLGLAIVKKLVESYGGEVGVRSEPGAGACFWFTWPRHLETTDLVGDETRDLLAPD